MDSETTACVACLIHSCSLRPGWDTDCNQKSGWELGRRHAGRQDRHLSHPLCGGKCTDITLKGAPRATFTRHQTLTLHKVNLFASFWSSGCYSGLQLCFSSFCDTIQQLLSWIYYTAFNGRRVVLVIFRLLLLLSFFMRLCSQLLSVIKGFFNVQDRPLTLVWKDEH